MQRGGATDIPSMAHPDPAPPDGSLGKLRRYPILAWGQVDAERLDRSEGRHE
jgi:hypothetical protein